MNCMKLLTVFTALTWTMSAGLAQEMLSPSVPEASGSIVLVAGGCGPGAWRGPYGHCRNTPFYGRLPSGEMRCPQGSWVGPYGHCRNTPFHGVWPDGSVH
jgi:hypothetical protein